MKWKQQHYVSSCRRLMRQVGLGTKHVLKPLLYAYPPVGLQPERLMTWLQALSSTLGVDGNVVEIGCNLGGTAAVSSRMLQRLGSQKTYVCIDTFRGFVADQFEQDIQLGNAEANRHYFSCNSPRLARWVLDRHGANSVQLVEADICDLTNEQVPGPVAACLIDVDLAEPVRVSLEKVYPKLSPGGKILVDDCPERYAWQARKGYEVFMQQRGLRTRYEFGMGIVSKDL